MFREYLQKLEHDITQKENLALVRSTAQKFAKTHTIEECWQFSIQAWKSEYFQIQELAVFICGYIAHEYSPALSFLENEVIHHSNWRVQEVLAMAFDSYCKNIGYEQALSIIQKWLQSDNDKQRRAVTEGLRVWTSRPFFKDNPKVAIQLLSALKADPSEYVRKSVGNALRDISKRNPELIRTEIENWDLTDKRIAQVYKLAHRVLEKS